MCNSSKQIKNFITLAAAMIKIRNYVDVEFHVSFWRHFVKTILTLAYFYVWDIFIRSAKLNTVIIGYGVTSISLILPSSINKGHPITSTCEL